MNSQVYIGLSLLGICAVVGAGVGVGSGFAVLAQGAMLEAEKQQKTPGVASPFEKSLVSKGFAASGISK